MKLAVCIDKAVFSVRQPITLTLTHRSIYIEHKDLRPKMRCISTDNGGLCQTCIPNGSVSRSCNLATFRRFERSKLVILTSRTYSIGERPASMCCRRYHIWRSGSSLGLVYFEPSDWRQQWQRRLGKGMANHSLHKREIKGVQYFRILQNHISACNSHMPEDETLFYQSTLTALHKPNHRDLGFLQQWMRRSDMGGVYLVGQDSDTWSDPDLSDLVALQARHADDPFTTWVTDKAVHWWHRVVGRYLRASKLETPSDINDFITYL